MNGGCGTLAPAYLKMVKSCKRNKGRGAEQTVINSYQGGKKAYIDPNDPSVIYLQQPDVVQNLDYNPFGYQPINQPQPMQVAPQQPNYNNNVNYQPAPMPNVPNNNYPNYQMNQNQFNQPPMNNMNNMPPNYGNNINNNYPNFNNNNQQPEMDLPSSEEVYAQSNNNNMNQQQYPEHGMEGLNGVINNQPQEGGRYFGFWGPSLDRNPNP